MVVKGKDLRMEHLLNQLPTLVYVERLSTHTHTHMLSRFVTLKEQPLQGLANRSLSFYLLFFWQLTNFFLLIKIVFSDNYSY